MYAGIHVDYKGFDVTAANVLAVLRGDPMEGVGSGRTIASGPDDRVFFFYSDHGATGAAPNPAPSSPQQSTWTGPQCHLYACITVLCPPARNAHYSRFALIRTAGCKGCAQAR